jgi:heme exporter protein CcmD
VNAFLAMGGYAAFVWPAYALGAAVFAWNIWAARRLHARALARAIRRAASGGESRAP